MGNSPTVLIIDDNGSFVDSIVAAFKRKGIHAQGCKSPKNIFKLSKREDFKFDLILLDMRLGNFRRGEALNASKVLPHLKTYSPASKVVVFTQNEISVEECVQCIQLGALAIIPKTGNIDDLVLIADVYQHLGDQNEAREELIRGLWRLACDSKEELKGQYLEMLMINIFESIPTFAVIGRNIQTNAGEIDILVRNDNQHDFWKLLESVQWVIECKNRGKSSQLTVLNQLQSLILTRGKLSRAGILVSFSSVTSGGKRRRDEIREHNQCHIFFLDRWSLQSLIECTYDQRESYLRDLFGKQ